ncbi:hypothetical protein TPHA_0A00400 [Tetrapisispora phaffii CBS 4417]|uniref:prephenate dehydratase n=1 Tax=Tetrapisispora phaffii (strain ATCC 24235 / CBS 4417 / NBRC 1672 / NRRL Y-8282 / UCD 70-5) TaxID=1071381 RepID=G8BMJ7_TETPH|nr:hypothetical protein TPHA_0A00400 [Tetrapisispora phaffii CBS 4417]CCE61125.1 hypothetical protein TPHA_0A00400 [Tetrapisispora phaffii CBS 4417]
MKKVLFLGPEGTYSHQAAIQAFENSNDVKYIPSPSIVHCFDELERNNEYSYSVVPLENSTNGQVVFSYDILRDRMLNATKKEGSQLYEPLLKIVGEQYVSIAHCLIGSNDIQFKETLEEEYDTIQIYSHPQVWGQVAKYLENLGKKYPKIKFRKSDTSSTSEAVTVALEQQTRLDIDGNPNKILNLAIGSQAAAKINGAQILQANINDIKGNTTRFLVLKRRNEVTPMKELLSTDSENISLITFTIDDSPGSLVDILNVLKQFSLNMCSINSRPFTSNKLSTRKWQYVFFVEYQTNQALSEQEWNDYYTQLNQKSLKWTLWGSFPRDKRYYD